VVEVARLESVYRFIAYPGFESPSLRQIKKNASLLRGICHLLQQFNGFT